MKQDEWQPGHKVVYVKNPDYVPRSEPPDYLSGGKIAKIDRLEWLYIPDNNTALSALQAGEIDYFEAPPLDFMEPLQEQPRRDGAADRPLGAQGIIRPNSAQPPFNNYKARQALLHLVNQDQTLRAVVGSEKYYMKFCGSFFMCGSANGTEVGSEGLKDFSIEKAKQLLKEGGYNGEKLVVILPTDRPQYNAATMVLIQNLRKAGVAVDAQAMDWSTALGRRAKKDGWNIVITTHGGPDTTIPIGNVWFNSRCEQANIGWACDPELEKLVGCLGGGARPRQATGAPRRRTQARLRIAALYSAEGSVLPAGGLSLQRQGRPRLPAFPSTGTSRSSGIGRPWPPISSAACWRRCR